MSIGKIIAGGVIVVGTFPIIAGAFKLFLVLFGFLWISDCSARLVGYPLILTAEEKLAEKKQWEERLEKSSQEWEKKRDFELREKMAAGDIEAQTDLATLHLYSNDDPADDQEAVKWLIAAAKKDCAEAQYHLGRVYWKEGDKTKAREQWILAAQGREDRIYGTGSYKARENLRYHFPDDYDPKWRED